MRGGECGDGERGRDHLGEAPRQTSRGRLCRKLQESTTEPHLLRSELSALSALSNSDVHPRWNDDQKRSSGNAEEIRHFQSHVPEMHKLSVASR